MNSEISEMIIKIIERLTDMTIDQLYQDSKLLAENAYTILEKTHCQCLLTVSLLNYLNR
ncbi:hypothetical protein XNC1_2248 [Xenorhabdus nematophila ATCC 19061]|uniref:Uncharacterized protein n=1 Tax=Xenorhabdus nematophila (strain ATCC 19061 / DSM 3370 / CCUG 14189 / LMG 1036 / NCIMB 9965 / AN6) TaxID=406817 RepID=D3VFJ3_XENNA|nr:hypothetical protein XNC1_2248 [Xenorhabdus nematophila ATCC 19061]